VTPHAPPPPPVDPSAAPPGSAFALAEELRTTWQTNHRINLRLLADIRDEGFDDALSTRGGRGVAGEFAHMHDIRGHHLEKRAPDLAEGLVRFTGKGRTRLESAPPPTRDELISAHEASAAAIETLLVEALHSPPKSPRGAPRRRAFKRGIVTTLSYFIAHEAHHRGRILLTLKVAGHTLDRKTQNAIWGWDRI
jgi:uncharacterized damage-inducible protein DinB